MKKFIVTTLLLLPLLVSTVEPQMSAQNSRNVLNNEQVEKEERSKIFEECVKPGRPMPEVKTQHPILCGKAISLPKPRYPELAEAQGVSGMVSIKIVTDEKGWVIWAEAAEGHPLLQEAARKAACLARYSPLILSKQAVKASSVISYSFVRTQPTTPDATNLPTTRTSLIFNKKGQIPIISY